jgi:HSP20 family protein
MLFDPFAGFGPAFRTAGRAGFLPAVDATVGENDIVITIDLPGLTAEDVEIELLKGELYVRGERTRPQPAEGTQWAHSERTFGSFERRIGLPEGVDPDAITASMDNGVLSLIIPKPEAIKPRTIAIGSGSEQRQLAGAAA